MMRVAKAALVLAICMSAGMLATASAQTLLMSTASRAIMSGKD